jgi:hypothetical protein
MDVLAMASPADAAVWIADRFKVPSIPARKRLDGERRRDRVGYERGLTLLIRSGLWARLSLATQAIAPVLVDFAERQRPHDEVGRVQMAYRTIARFSGIQSHNAIRKGLVELSEIGFLVLPLATVRSLDRQSASYTVTPTSQELWEFAQMAARQMQQEIDAEIELRKRQRNDRLASKRTR